MSMLAEKKRREIWSINPRGKSWSNDHTKFGQRLLEKMGWKIGQGLGVNNQGSAEIINVKKKSDVKGFGFKENGEEWLKTTNDFEMLLGELSTSMEKNVEEQVNTVSSLEDRSKNSKTRVHYQKFTRGKDLSRYSEKDLASIIGTDVLKLNKVDRTVDNYSKTEVQAPSSIDHCSQVEKGVSQDSLFELKCERRKKFSEEKNAESNNRSFQNDVEETNVEFHPEIDISSKKNKKLKHFPLIENYKNRADIEESAQNVLNVIEKKVKLKNKKGKIGNTPFSEQIRPTEVLEESHEVVRYKKKCKKSKRNCDDDGKKARHHLEGSYEYIAENHRSIISNETPNKRKRKMENKIAAFKQPCTEDSYSKDKRKPFESELIPHPPSQKSDKQHCLSEQELKSLKQEQKYEKNVVDKISASVVINEGEQSEYKKSRKKLKRGEKLIDKTNVSVNEFTNKQKPVVTKGTNVLKRITALQTIDDSSSSHEKIENFSLQKIETYNKSSLETRFEERLKSLLEQIEISKEQKIDEKSDSQKSCQVTKEETRKSLNKGEKQEEMNNQTKDASIHTQNSFLGNQGNKTQTNMQGELSKAYSTLNLEPKQVLNKLNDSINKILNLSKDFNDKPFRPNKTRRNSPLVRGQAEIQSGDRQDTHTSSMRFDNDGDEPKFSHMCGSHNSFLNQKHFIREGRGVFRVGRGRVSQNNFDAKQYAKKCKILNKIPELSFKGVDLQIIPGYALRKFENSK